MAELTPKEQLQPSLLDRLADDEPERRVEPRENRVLSIERLHDCVVRDLEWLLNSDNMGVANDLSEFPEAAASTVNYGIPTLSGQMLSRADRRRMEQSIRESIMRFEPRLIANTVEVRAILDEEQMHRNALTFEIGATVWAQPLPIQMLVNAEVDIETGDFRVVSK